MNDRTGDDEPSFSVSGTSASGLAGPGSSHGAPPAPPKCRKDVTVKFHLMKAQVVAHAYPRHHTVDEVREHIACKFQVKSKFLVLRQAGAEVPGHRRLGDICVSEYNVCDLELLLSEAARDENVLLNLKLYYKNLTLPDIITVRIPSEDGKPSRDVVVEIENQVITKPFVGGYINKHSHIEYHHAFTQTGPPLERLKGPGQKYSRDTQTVCERHTTTTSIPRSQGVQHSGPVALIPSPQTVPSGHCLVAHVPYESHAELERRQDLVGKVRLIQRNFRRVLWQRLIRKSAAEWRALQQQQEANETDAQRSKALAHNKTCVARTFPRTKEEFDALFAQIHCWKENELKLIGEKYSGAPKIAEMNILLDKEIQLLNGVERQRRAIQREQTEAVVERQLAKISEPKRWVGCNNRVIEMETPQTQRARFLLLYYQRLKMFTQPTGTAASGSDPQERVALLDELSDVIVHECHPATEELENLLQRERKLLLCNLGSEDLSPLRKRQLALLAEIIRSDPEKAREKKATKLCRKCKKLRPTHAFTVHTRQRSADICGHCSSLLGSTVDIAVYRSILRAVRRDERKRGSLASYAFIIQENDVKHIVENIWHGHSIISNAADRADLMLPRWNVAECWSPWNCVCLTEQETRAHLKLQRLDRYYQPSVLKEIQSKHALARSVFGQLREIDQEFTESGDWWQVGLNGKVV
ncbi:IQ and ubiquitin-like domain-containing protein [Anopheles ziemanni]|uniref:IQ and ubiquitin-like domain-containing protein n=1 Tax=Anopheles coustani TaxID=139045 RepID=UPI0026582621|nr:IQ and ubiquitin-like domain-containing protein [Anopheles coustani]XP_058173496.1 IQ and ubiquitin-like domain-containing protein [Anopheles ziemanni]